MSVRTPTTRALRAKQRTNKALRGWLIAASVIAPWITSTASAGEETRWNALGEPRVGAMAAYGPVGLTRVTTLETEKPSATWRLGYRFAERWWAGLHVSSDPTEAGGALGTRSGTATLAGQYDFGGGGGLKPYIGAGATFRAEPVSARLSSSIPVGAVVRVGLDYSLAPGLHSYAELDSTYIRRDVDVSARGLADSALKDAVQWRTGLVYRF